MLIICVKRIMYLLLHNLHDCEWRVLDFYLKSLRENYVYKEPFVSKER